MNDFYRMMLNSSIQFKLLKCICNFTLENDFQRLHASNVGDFVRISKLRVVKLSVANPGGTQQVK